MSKWLNYFSPNVSHLHGHKRLDDDASLLPQESDGVVFWMRKGAVLLKHTKKLILGQPAHILQWLLCKKVVATVWPFTLTPNPSSLTGP